jgi:UDP-3-O-[3-hydroxymyristoyl] glucosamine N-acyltransferase
MRISARQLAEALGGELQGDGEVEVRSVAPAGEAAEGAVTFAENPVLFEQALASRATVILAGTDAPAPRGKTIIRVPSPRVAFARALALFHPPEAYPAGIHPTAIVAGDAEIGPGAHIGPYAVIKQGARIGARTAIDAGAVVGAGAILGEECVLHPRVVLYPRVVLGNRVVVHAGTVIGSDGFGYVQDGGKHVKVPQVGTVVVGDDVEIGANTTIDRATLGATRIGRGSKIDNLVQIAHNDVVGEHCVLAAQVGLAGSVTLGRYVMLGGQVGVADHKTVGERTMVGGQGGVIGDVPAGSVLWGTPAQPRGDWLRQIAALKRLAKK